MENVSHLLEVGDFTARYNVIAKQLELGRTDGSPATMSQIVSFAVLHGLSTRNLHDFVDELAHERSYNPIRDWIESRPWDGQDRLPAFCATIHAVSDYPAGLKEQLMTRWLLSAAAAATFGGEFRTRGVLTLQGEQGVGKTSWIRNLLPAGPLQSHYVKVDHHLDGGNKDSIIGAISHFIVEIGELDSSFRKDIARLKGFLTSNCDKLRRPYAKGETKYPRRTVFAASVNASDFLVDNTGNSRWWTIAVESIDFNHDIDMQQLFAQAAERVAEGVQWWLTPDEEARLTDYNKRHRSLSAISERIRDFYDGREGNPTASKTPSEVLADIGINNPTNPQARECGAVLRELFGPPTRVQGRDRWKVPKAEPTGFRPLTKHREVGPAQLPNETF